MKYSNLFIGIIVFVAFITLYFTWLSGMSSSYDSENSARYTELSGKYNYVDNLSNSQNSTLRKISNTLDSVGLETVSEFVAGADQSVAAVKQTKDSLIVVSQVGSDMTDDLQIDPIFNKVFIGIITVLIVLGIVYMFMKFKMET